MEDFSKEYISSGFDDYCAHSFYEISNKHVAELSYNYYNLYCHTMWSLLSTCNCYIYKNSNMEVKICPYFEGKYKYLYISDSRSDIIQELETHGLIGIKKINDKNIIGCYTKDLHLANNEKDLEEIADYIDNQIKKTAATKPEKIDFNSICLKFVTIFSHNNSKLFSESELMEDESNKILNLILFRIFVYKEDKPEWILNYLTQSNMFDNWDIPIQKKLPRIIYDIRLGISIICSQLTENIHENVDVVLCADKNSGKRYESVEAENFIECLKRSLIDYLESKSVAQNDKSKITFLSELLTRISNAKTPDCSLF